MLRFAALFSALLASFVARAGDQDFVLVNDTGFDIFELYVAPADSNNWEEDVLSVETLPAGQSTVILFDQDEGQCIWDIRVVDQDDAAIEWFGINLCEISSVTLHWKKNRPWATVN